MLITLTYKNNNEIINKDEINEIKAKFNIPNDAILFDLQVRITAINEPYEHTLSFHWEE